jgi:hypothetical protein
MLFVPFMYTACMQMGLGRLCARLADALVIGQHCCMLGAFVHCMLRLVGFGQVSSMELMCLQAVCVAG